MKLSAILFLLFCMMARTSKAQTLIADDMIAKTACNSFDCYNEFITAKGFRFEESPDIKDTHSYYFVSNYVVAHGEFQTRDKAMINISNDGNQTDLRYSTSEQTYYLRLYNSFKEKGFVATHTSNGSNNVATEYKSRRFPTLKLTVTIERLSNNGHAWTSYDFLLEKR